jgi:hypothetical protein
MQIYSRLKSTLLTFLEDTVLRRSVDRVYSVISGHIFFQTLRSAIELGVFDLLKRRPGLTADELRAELGLQEQPLRILMLGLVYLRLVKKRGPRYYNTLASQMCFCNDSTTCINEIVRWQHSINYAAMPYLLDSLRQNKNVGLRVFPGEEPTLYERLSHAPELEAIFQRAMVQISRQANAALRENLDLSGVRFIVDIGGGIGENVLQLVDQWPHLRGGVYDLPTVARLAERNFAASPNRARLEVFTGSCFEDPLPTGPDAFLLCHFLTIWSKEQNLELLRKCHAALPAGGRVVIFNMMQSNSGDGPGGAAMGSPYFLCLATGKGMLYTWGEYSALLHQAEFARVKTYRLPRQHGIIVGFKGSAG